MSEQGRPTVYSEGVANEILDRLADGQSLRSICDAPGMPGRTTVYRWVMDDVSGFRNQYARAREIQAYALEDDLRDIADDGRNDWMRNNDPKNPGWIANGEHLNRSRLRVDARKWAASKILPKVYGEKITQEVTTDNIHRIIGEAPIDKEAWAAKYANGVAPVIVESDDAT